MKYTKTAIRELNAKYRAVLKKMFLINAAVLLTFSINASANAAVVSISDGQPFENLINNNEDERAAGLTLSYGDTLSQDGANNVKFINNSSVNSGGAMKALNGFTAGDNWEFDGNHSDKISGGLYVKIPNSGSENRNVTFGDGTTFSNNTSKWLGGALGIEAADTVTLGDNATFDKNHSDADGGAIAVWTDGTNTDVTTGTTLNLGKTTFTDNTATNRRGALANLNNDTTPTAHFNTVNIGAGSTFTNNSAKQGGAIYNKGAMNISGATFDGNSAAEGGAIYVRGSEVYQSDSDMAVLTIDNSTFKNNTTYPLTTPDKEITNAGGAISVARNSNVTISNSTFDGNKAQQGWGGAIFAYAPNTDGTRKGGILTITNSSFTNNEALGIGAVGLYSKSTLKNVSFDGNKATDANDDGGGAIFLGSVSKTTIDGATFTKNTSAAAGGAIATRDNVQGRHADATLDLSNATFVENMAGTNGGAIYNTFYNDAANSGFASLSTVSFDKNSAKLGGAIYNDGTGDKVVSGKDQGFASMHITDGTFTNNTASENGGAIYNSGQGVINLSGTNTFTGNTAAGVANDIHNDGILNIAGTLVLDGGITGNGTVNFDNGTSLKTALLADASSSAIVKANKITGNDINLVIENGSNGGQVKFEAAENTLTIANNNALYNIEGDDTGLFNVTKKSSSELAETLGAEENQAAAVLAVTNGTCDNAKFNAISEAVNELLQSSDPNAVATGVKAASTLAPATIHVPTAHTTQNVNQIFSAVSSRLSSGSISSMGGQSSGDEILGNGAVWAKALYNKSKLSTQDGFDAYSRGLAIGAEGHVHDQVKIGVAYAYTNSDIKPDDRKSEIDSNSAILYAEYKPNNWFLNGIASYTWGRYDEHKYVLGTDVGAKYDVNSFSAQVQTGYDFYVRNYTLTPEIGLRYMNIDQKGFTDTIGNYTNANKSDVFTGVIGATAKAAYAVNGNVMLKPELRIAATYDFVNDDVASVMTLANGSVISAQGEALKKFGTEVGFGLTAVVADNVELGIGYEGKFRKHYSDNTGMITAKYNF